MEVSSSEMVNCNPSIQPMSSSDLEIEAASSLNICCTMCLLDSLRWLKSNGGSHV